MAKTAKVISTWASRENDKALSYVSTLGVNDPQRKHNITPFFSSHDLLKSRSMRHPFMGKPEMLAEDEAVIVSSVLVKPVWKSGLFK